MQRDMQHEEAQTVMDGNYEITVTPWLRARFQEIKVRNDAKYADKGGGLCKTSQYEMYLECEYKEGRVLELMYWLAREQGVRTDSDINERVRMFSSLTRSYSCRVAAGQARDRKQAASIPAPVEELVTV